jgi:type VI protein secretion system component Hcp
MAAARRRRRDEEARTRELGETGKEEARERSVAGEAVRLQEMLGNVSATEVMASTEGRHIPTAELRAEKSGAVFALKLTDVLITTFQANIDADPPLETITLNFAAAEYEHGDKKTK